MAKRRILKRDISYVAGDLFSEALFCKLYLPGVNSEKADVVMARVLDMQDEFGNIIYFSRCLNLSGLKTIAYF